MEVGVGKFIVEFLFLQAICFPDLAFDPVAGHGGFERALGNRYHDLCPAHGGQIWACFFPDHPQGVCYIGMASFKKAPYGFATFESFWSGEG